VDHGGRWRGVGIVLGVGAVYDLVFGLAILGPTRLAASILGLTVPADPVYLYLNGVFLLLLAGLYAAAAREPERYRAVAPIATLGRLLGFAVLAWAGRGGRPAAFLALGLADLALAAATAGTWWRAVRLSD
jgi:hypothetical protein